MPNQAEFVQMQLSSDTCALEIAYSQACGQFEMICESEKARHLRLEILLLENENNELYNQLAQADGRIDDLENYTIDERQEWEATTEQLDTIQKDLRMRNREVETLKAELTSLCGVKKDSTKLLTEKLHLAREISNLKPELDHLRSQNLAFQSLLSEKLSLQRQLSTLQVEIDNERRSKQRETTKEGKIQTGDANSEACLESVRAELVKEKKEKLCADRELQKSSAVFQNKLATYESRLDAFRGKLKSTKESLKEVQSELQKYQAAGPRLTTTSAQQMARPRNTQKRAASEMDADTMLGTPGDLAPAKSKKAKPLLLGEKSTFSMTPFLNRTASLGPESPSFVGKRNNDQGTHRVPSPSPDKTLKVPPCAKSAALMRMEQNVTEDKDNFGTKIANRVVEKGKRLPTRRSGKKAMASPKLSQVTEEVEVNVQAVSDNALSVPPRMEDSMHQANDGVEKKKVKRKILGGNLGKTLFDEDDGDALKGDRRIGAARTFMKQRRGGLGEAMANAGAVGTFGPFSPLKKDRKSVAV